ncbi:MAG: hypothetical protein KatS3mg103_0254 [Phycisphaerales bacterium]|nr:MAG: hypothetical protein KatS3mg103_0254 [Phycisphaerales bacterium]
MTDRRAHQRHDREGPRDACVGFPEAVGALPDGLTEADLLAWVEADGRTRASAGPGSALARVDAAIACNPALGRWLEAMRVDRAAMGALEHPAAPAWLAQAVLDEHERQALLGLAGDPAVAGRPTGWDEDNLPFSLSAMPGWFKPALAVAAGLGLVFAAWQLLPWLQIPGLRPPASGGGAVAQGQGPATADGAAPNAPAGGSLPPDGAMPGVPRTPGPADVQEATPRLAADPVRPPAILTPSVPTPERVLAQRLGMPADEALERALQGRLVFVVQVPDAQAAIEASEAIAGLPVDPSWTMARPSASLLAALAEPAHVRIAGLDPAPADGPLLAAEDGPLGQLRFVLDATPAASVVHASATPRAMLSLLDGLETLGSWSAVVVDDPLPTAGRLLCGPPMGPLGDAVLWWDADPATWGPWAAIPIRFVETR